MVTCKALCIRLGHGVLQARGLKASFSLIGLPLRDLPLATPEEFAQWKFLFEFPVYKTETIRTSMMKSWGTLNAPTPSFIGLPETQG